MDTTLLQQQIALCLLEGIGPIKARLLLSKVDTISDVFHLKLGELSQRTGLTAKSLHSMKREKALEIAASHLPFLLTNKVKCLFIDSPHYPRRLKQCVDAPLLLFMKGSVDLNQAHYMAVVGTRAASAYGRRVVEELVQQLKGKEVVLVSGLAYGIDGIAHQACLKHNIPTVGVLGHGLDRIYPHKHRKMAEHMLEQGGLLTEFLPYTNPDRENFPKRNRIVAGMCDATIVVESKAKGGSLITAELSNDYNRDVFAVPGNIYEENAVGCNRLIASSKAHIFQNPEQFLNWMNWNKSAEVCQGQKELWKELSENEKQLIGMLESEGDLHMDVLSYKCSLPISQTIVILFQLEMSGLIRALPGKRYSLSI